MTEPQSASDQMSQLTHRPLKVLVSGAGIAGPCLATLLTSATAVASAPSKVPVHVTVVERAPAPRPHGQNVDIRGKGIDVVARMGLLPAVRAQNTTEAGINFVDANNKVKASFPVLKGGGGFTSEFEIMRGTLAQIFYDASLNGKGAGGNVRYLFGETIKAIHEEADGARIEFANGAAEDKFDVVVGADGLGSSVRRLAFPDAGRDVFKPLGQIAAFFQIPLGPTDGPMARWYNAPQRRCIFLRPDNVGTTRALLSIINKDDRLRSVLKSGAGTDSSEGVKKQKALIREFFEDAGWEAQRVMEGMDKAEDFYMQEVAQVRMDTWHTGRTVLLGDAGYCPSPISGQGTTTAITGAYILAGELLKHGRDVQSALQGYETAMRPIVKEAQELFPGAPNLLNPETKWGISIMNGILRTITFFRVPQLFGGGDGTTAKDRVQDYDGLPQLPEAA